MCRLNFTKQLHKTNKMYLVRRVHNIAKHAKPGATDFNYIQGYYITNAVNFTSQNSELWLK